MTNEPQTCQCKEMTCTENCTKNHTCHAYWCKNCRPEESAWYKKDTMEKFQTPTFVAPQEKEWREKIRHDYKGILSDEIIENTVRYWEIFISKEKQRSYEEGKESAIEEMKPCAVEVLTYFDEEVTKKARLTLIKELLAELPKKLHSAGSAEEQIWFETGFNDCRGEFINQLHKKRKEHE